MIVQVTRCDRCNTDTAVTQPAQLRGGRLDLCEACTDLVIGDRAAWSNPPPEQGQSVMRGQVSRPPVHGVAASELDPNNPAHVGS